VQQTTVEQEIPDLLRVDLHPMYAYPTSCVRGSDMILRLAEALVAHP
jgi:hypothetical protein